MTKSLNPVQRAGVLIFGLVAYALFLFTILYAIGFVGNFWPALGWSQPWLRMLDIEMSPTSLAQALLIDAGLLTVFAVQHSGMARTGFKQAWTRVIPQCMERSTFVLAASLCLCLLFWQWRPIGTVVLWDLSRGPVGRVLMAVSILGWAIVFLSTFMINHFDLFGLRQAWFGFRGKSYPELEFATPGFYRVVRHPIYLGFIIAFWATPVMTLGHLVFTLATTLYILGAIQLEERDLVHRYGDLYRQYRARVRMLAPLPPSNETAPASRAPESLKPAR